MCCPPVWWWEKGAVVESAVVLNESVVRAGARVERAIVDLHVEVPGDALVVGGTGDDAIAVCAAPGDDED